MGEKRTSGWAKETKGAVSLVCPTYNPSLSHRWCRRMTEVKKSNKPMSQLKRAAKDTREVVAEVLQLVQIVKGPLMS